VSITKAEFDRVQKEMKGNGQMVEFDWKPLAEYGLHFKIHVEYYSTPIRTKTMGTNAIRPLLRPLLSWTLLNSAANIRLFTPEYDSGPMKAFL